MSAEAVEQAGQVILARHEAHAIAAAVRAVVFAAEGVPGGRRLDAEEFAALRTATSRLTMAVFSIGGTDADVIDLDRERDRRRR
jgi:hypothetical protein